MICTGSIVAEYCLYHFVTAVKTDQESNKQHNDCFHSVLIKGGQPCWIANSGLYRFLQTSGLKFHLNLDICGDVEGHELVKIQFFRVKWNASLVATDTRRYYKLVNNGSWSADATIVLIV